MKNKFVIYGCLGMCLLAGCKVDEAKRGPGAASTSSAPQPVQTPAKAVRAAPRAAPAESWNDEGIAWRSVDAGLAEAKKSGKPVMLVVYTDWCPHCRNYSKLFSDDRVVQAAKKFVMIRIDQGASSAESARFAPDGTYIPRTMFMTPEGELMKDVKAREDKFFYFYRENDPGQLLAAMARVAK